MVVVSECVKGKAWRDEENCCFVLILGTFLLQLNFQWNLQ